MAEIKDPQPRLCPCRTCSLWRMFQKIPTDSKISCGDGETISTQWVILRRIPYFQTLTNFEKKKDNSFSLKDFRSRTVEYFLKLYVLGDTNIYCRRKEPLTILCEVMMLGSFLEETVVSKALLEETVSQYNVHHIIDICRDFPLLPPEYQDFLLRRVAQALSPCYTEYFGRFRHAMETLHPQQKDIVCRICNDRKKETVPPLLQKSVGRLRSMLNAIPTTCTFECLDDAVEIHPPVIQKISRKAGISTDHIRKIFRNYNKATIDWYLDTVLTAVPFNFANYITYPYQKGLQLLAGIFMLGYEIGITVYSSYTWVTTVTDRMSLDESMFLYTIIPEKYVYYRQPIIRRISNHLTHLGKPGSNFLLFLNFHIEISKILSQEDIEFCHRMITSAGIRRL